MKKWKMVATFMAVAVLAGAFVVGSQNSVIQAANKPDAPDNVKFTEHNYYKYWDKHEKELIKDGKFPGDGDDVVVSWNRVSGADGYRVAVFWSGGEKETEKSVIDVKKESGKYIFEAKTVKKDGRDLAKSAKDFIYNDTKTKIYSSKLSFFMTARGSIFEVKKVKVKSYKLIKGKRVYSKYTTAYPKN